MSPRPIIVPFDILVDSCEQTPFSFKGLKADADKDHRPLEVHVERRHLGATMGDYSIAIHADRTTVSHVGKVSIERKSQEDAYGTFLGWGERRERFERELAALANMTMACVIVECSLGKLISDAPEWGKKTSNENAKCLHRIVLSWQTEFRIPWFFCDTKRLAEMTAFRFLERYFRKHGK